MLSKFCAAVRLPKNFTQLRFCFRRYLPIRTQFSDDYVRNFFQVSQVAEPDLNCMQMERMAQALNCSQAPAHAAICSIGLPRITCACVILCMARTRSSPPEPLEAFALRICSRVQPLHV